MLDRQEILRYLEIPNSNSTIDNLIDRAEKEVLQAARPKHTSRRIFIRTDISTGKTLLAGTEITSRSLTEHLQGCQEGFLFACTLGPGIDSLVKRYSLTEPPMLPVIQAVSAACTEYYADQAQKELEDYAAEHNLFLRPRYSPGYGDFSLSCQRFLFDALDIPKKIGVSLTSSFLMIPFKSVTAVIGLSPDPSLCHVHKCMTCTAKNCPFRKEDGKNV